MRDLGSLEVHVEPAVQMRAPRHVGQGQVLAAQVRMLGELSRDHAPDTGTILDRLLYRRHVAFLGRRADQAPEYRGDITVEAGLLRIHPMIDGGAGTRVLRPQLRMRRVGMAKIAADRVALPQHEVVFLQRRHQPGRVHRTIFRRVRLAVRTADIDALVGKLQFFECPDHLHHVARCGTAPQNAAHRLPPCLDASSLGWRGARGNGLHRPSKRGTSQA